MKDEGNPGKPWNINIEWQWLAARTTVVQVAGDLRGDGAASLRRTLAGELAGTPELLVLDLSDIEQIDVDGIDALDAIVELAAKDDIRFCLVFPPKGVDRRRLNVVELSKRFQTFSSVNEALQPPMSGPHSVQTGCRHTSDDAGRRVDSKAGFRSLRAVAIGLASKPRGKFELESAKSDDGCWGRR